ncbi:hypothetical protein LTR37_014700 [Vermiconidia calcicola]|uniref:Uncharacterized protein n=1 Tax=Vermiconidia calcicola TaxID=1690605 RepID=A0ACC3MT05_9PEZI|nr:hypothetical protein LTR37_014700 [Vermiconidia calcicola]
MPPPLESYNGSSDNHSDSHAQSDADHHDRVGAEIDLTLMSVEAREKYYKECFSKMVEPLKCLSEPDLCNTFPELKIEIIGAYLRYTTFTVQVWANYDAACKKFHTDGRMQDCGKLERSSPNAERILHSIATSGLEFGRIRYEIGTAFMTLCAVNFRVIRPKDDAGVELKISLRMYDSGHPSLYEFVRSVCQHNQGVELAYSQQGLQIRDIVEIASFFKRKPTAEEMAPRSYWKYTGNSPWMDLSGKYEDNFGWVDFDELERDRRRGQGQA